VQPPRGLHHPCQLLAQRNRPGCGELAQGSFVIGDQNATGGHVTFWGALWPLLNPLSGSPPPVGFFGVAPNTANDPPRCGDGWAAGPGDGDSWGMSESFEPPKSVPALMAVIVSSSSTWSKGMFHGNVVKVVVVKANPGYAPDIFHVGTGTIVAQICP
jgi:hypothetical protein